MAATAMLSGCASLAKDDDAILLSVDWQEGQVLRYKFTSGRQAEIDWSSMDNKAAQSERKTSNYAESMEMVMNYTPVEVDPYGLTTIKATCESVSTQRVSDAGRTPGQDAANSLRGKSFILKIAANGKIEDYSSLEQVLYEVGEKAFRVNEREGRIKDPDMTMDILATQWFLWDAVSSVTSTAGGVDVNDVWQSMLSVPAPMLMKQGRTVTYRLAELKETEQGQIAVIRSTYSLAGQEQYPWPLPYNGSFRASGTFGFLQNYKVEELTGTGEEIFNVDKGRSESYDQNYQAKLTAGFMMGLPGRIEINVTQKLTMELLEQ
jgi:hypothetical protein